MSRAARILTFTATALAALAVLVTFFPWNLLRVPVNRYMSERTGRHFAITRHLDVELGRTTRILAEGVEIANPPWAMDANLVIAERAEVDVELLPLLHHRFEFPRIVLHKAQLGLQIEPDGRRTWVLARHAGVPGHAPPRVGTLVLDQGTAHVIARKHGVDVHVDFAIDSAVRDALPLAFSVRGTFRDEPFTAKGRTADTLVLRADRAPPFPMRVDAQAGRTQLRADGHLARLASLDGADADVAVQGWNLSDLYGLVGVVLPESPPYAVRGHLSRRGAVWRADRLEGALGKSDVAGDLVFDRGGAVPALQGKLVSKSLDFKDLSPLVGLGPDQHAHGTPEQPATGARAHRQRVAGGTSTVRQRKMFPTANIDLKRLREMNADVTFVADRVVHVTQLPIDRLDVHVRLQDGTLLLDPFEIGAAGGSLTGTLRLDGAHDPAVAQARFDAKSLQLNRLFPALKSTRASIGRIQGDIDLRGRGDNIAQLLATSEGKVAFVMGSGQISNRLLAIAGLDGGEIIKSLAEGDRNVGLRCAAAAFDVTRGRMSSRALVLDTTETVIWGEGQVNLADESMDLTFRPYPKDRSILSMRSPLTVTGSFAHPHAGVDKPALAGRAGAALALAAINPLLALAATVETGPGRDVDCSAVLRAPASTQDAARLDASARAQRRQDTAVLGGSGAPGSGRPTGLADRIASAKRDSGHVKGATTGTHGDSTPGEARSATRPAALASDAQPAHAPGDPGRGYGP